MPFQSPSRRSLILGAGVAGLTVAAPGLVSAQATPEGVASPVADAYDPYGRLPQVPSFNLTSTDVATGQYMATAQMGGSTGGGDISPQLSWNGFPDGTKSFVVTLFDPDIQTPSGFWHWAVVDLPVSTTELPTGAGAADSTLLPAGAFQLPNDVRLAQYAGAAPPKPQSHRYFFAVQALSVEQLGIDPQATPALLSAMISGSILARATLVPLGKA